MVNGSKIPLKDLRVERLSKKHGKDIQSFVSFEKELMDFLKEDALPNQEKHISTTHLWFYNNELAAYVTALADRISLTADLKEKFRKQGINYKSLPAVKIGRLCVADKFFRKGIGTHIIDWVIRMMARMNTKVGCRFITIDAKRIESKDKDPKHFYKKIGFEILKKREKGTIPMYKDAGKLIAELRQKSSSS